MTRFIIKRALSLSPLSISGSKLEDSPKETLALLPLPSVHRLVLDWCLFGRLLSQSRAAHVPEPLNQWSVKVYQFAAHASLRLISLPTTTKAFGENFSVVLFFFVGEGGTTNCFESCQTKWINFSWHRLHSSPASPAFDFQLVAWLSHVNKASNLVIRQCDPVGKCALQAAKGDRTGGEAGQVNPNRARGAVPVRSSVQMINGQLDKWKLYELH